MKAEREIIEKEKPLHNVKFRKPYSRVKSRAPTPNIFAEFAKYWDTVEAERHWQS